MTKLKETMEKEITGKDVLNETKKVTSFVKFIIVDKILGYFYNKYLLKRAKYELTHSRSYWMSILIKIGMALAIIFTALSSPC